MSWTVNEPINSPKQEADQHPQLFLILAGVRTGRTWDTPGDISEKVPTKQRRKKDKLRIQQDPSGPALFIPVSCFFSAFCISHDCFLHPSIHLFIRKDSILNRLCVYRIIKWPRLHLHFRYMQQQLFWQQHREIVRLKRYHPLRRTAFTIWTDGHSLFSFMIIVLIIFL